MRYLATLLARHGTIAWERAIEPAARVAEQGFVVDTALAARWKTRRRHPDSCSLLDYILANAEAQRIYLHAIRIDAATGRRSGGADTGGGGMALEV